MYLLDLLIGDQLFLDSINTFDFTKGLVEKNSSLYKLELFNN